MSPELEGVFLTTGSPGKSLVNKVGEGHAANSSNRGPASTWFLGPLVAPRRVKGPIAANIVSILAQPGERENISGLFDYLKTCLFCISFVRRQVHKLYKQMQNKAL